MAEINVRFELQRLGEPEMGVWCDHCRLPSAYRQDVVISVGRATSGVLTATVCDDCGHAQTRRKPTG